MQNEQIHLQVQHLAQKVTHLLALHKKQQATMQQLQKENACLRTQLRTRDEVARRLAHTLIHDTPTSTKKGVRQDWEAKIDSYISAVDKSIVYLERLL